MLKKMTITAALAGALSLAAIPFASAQGTGTEPPKAPDPSGAASSGAMSKSSGGSMMKKSSTKKSGGMMKKKHSMKKKM